MELRRPDYVLFVGPPFFGHLNPLLVQAAEMQRRGWRAAVATTSEGMAHLARRPAGVEAIDLGATGVDPQSAEALLARVSAERSFLVGLRAIGSRLNDLWPTLHDGLMRVLPADRPDVMVVDFATTAGIDAAEALGIPLVVNNADLLVVLSDELLPPSDTTPWALAGRSIAAIGWYDRLIGPLRRWLTRQIMRRYVDRPLNALRASRGLPPREFGGQLLGRLVLVNSAFGLEYERPLTPSIQMTGPMLREDGELTEELAAWLAEGDPVVYVSMGTLARPTDRLLSTMVEALGSGPFRALWPMRPELRAALPVELPARLRAEAWVPSPLAVLRHPNVRAFLTHCGTNSVQESLAAGTPIVGLPMFAAQDDMAWRVVDAGVGVRLEKHRVTAPELRAAIVRVIEEEAFRRGIVAIQRSFDLAGGVRRAADLIECAARGT
jgi:UDP:flavonoid glycosyltransferase YjiC (YdhE family)